MNNYLEQSRYPNLRNLINKRTFDGSNRLGGQISDTHNSVNEHIPTHGSYGELLFDERWRIKRRTILQRDGNQCVICFSREHLQVHHRQYHFVKEISQFKVPWDYDDSLLITLCKKCHNRGHSKYKVPNLSI
ncbi:5-methylcytosine-specific restriction endonuclease McrA [Mucilaginibacter sp. UYP25]